MQSSDFLDRLHKVDNKALSLIFSYGNTTVKAGYHVTEIKSARIETMDCGAKANQWQEITLQLWSPQTSEQGYMSVEKFLDIYKRVGSSLNLSDLAYMRVEYAEPGQAAISYSVTAISQGDEAITIHLEAPAVACKAADPSLGDIPLLSIASNSCCSPSSKKTEVCCG